VTSFSDRYGPVAVVAGASEGLGAAFAEALAARGLHLVLLARRGALLAELASRIAERHRVTVKTVTADLADGTFVEALRGATQGLEVGLAVYNAAYSFHAPLLDRPLADALRVVDVNVVGPLRFVHATVPAMRARGRGGVVLMASIAGFQGAPGLAAYAASKAFGIVLGESLWAELRPHGVDVVTACAGAIRTPNYGAMSAKEPPGTLDAAVVAKKALDALGRGPVVVPGAVNGLALFILRRVLTRAGAVGLMQRSTAKVLPGRSTRPPT
jgi:short-subunit dehydrogenase